MAAGNHDYSRRHDCGPGYGSSNVDNRGIIPYGTFAPAPATPLKMRAPHRRRPRKHQLQALPDEADRHSLAEQARYVGSPDHKDRPSFAGQPRLRADASCCPHEFAGDQETLNEWLRTAIRLGATGAPWEGLFPRYVWYKHQETVFEGRLVNRETGDYKGYPLAQDEWPAGIVEIYASHVRD